ncbi:zinc-binding dehydrogenase [Actinophytocola oryzae]|uniref:NADPH2:quinone reductase n=1 Tax=Actinophytocola oryzae TaxID=502181 RepID=A0A4R7V8X9_9PSEU|nr:zinc-binding dehydrogenase [Actinophytocola oryzae]TDV45362.1 NADPH2:quinone reductase [Actinophytocola oryzae]
MRAVEVTRFGGPEVLTLRESPDPVAGPGQLVVDVAAVDVLFMDARLRAGWGREWFSVEPPYVPGNGVAGTVRSVGSDVDGSWVGRRVLAHTGKNNGMTPVGGYAEQAVAEVSDVEPVPDALGLPEALTLLHDGPTVVLALSSANVRPGERVLVNAASGSLGTLFVPILKAAGAEVVGAARGARKLDFVREWGADDAVDYSTQDWTDRVGTVDVVFDGTGGDIGTAAYGLLRPGGRFLAYGSSAGEFPKTEPPRPGVTVVGILEMGKGVDKRGALTEMLAKAARGEVTPLVGQTFPLDQAKAAHEAIEARQTVGKTLLLT